MATPYSDVINSFIMKVEGYKLMALLPEDRVDIIMFYMNSAIAKFYKKWQ